MKAFDFHSGEILLVDKPYGWTSFDVVNKLRWKLRKGYQLKNFKVGHAGTLDPLATGLLVICTGKATKTIASLLADDKVYTGTFLLGRTTKSYDLEKPFDESVASCQSISEEDLEETKQSFLGETAQIPPIYSAKQIDGKRAYEHARTGEIVLLEPNIVKIKSFEIDTKRFPEIDFEIRCSKGTYIRSIAHDFGERLGVGATLIDLRRVQSGDFSIKEAKSVTEWLEVMDAIP